MPLEQMVGKIGVKNRMNIRFRSLNSRDEISVNTDTTDIEFESKNDQVQVLNSAIKGVELTIPSYFVTLTNKNEKNFGWRYNISKEEYNQLKSIVDGFENQKRELKITENLLPEPIVNAIMELE